jgi:uncharacterized protein (DUF2141 family)
MLRAVLPTAIILLATVGCSCRGESGPEGGAAGSAAAPLGEAPASGGIEVTVQGVRNGSGAILVSLFASPEGFPSDYPRAAAVSRSDAAEGGVVARFDAVPVGRYAVAVLHDENGNEALDAGVFGMPREGFGVSNNPALGLGPPSFADAAFEYDGTATGLRVEVRYLTSQ